MMVLCKLSEGARPPTYAHDGDSGADVYAHGTYHLPRGSRKLIRTGVRLQTPYGYEWQVRPKSGRSLAGLDVAFGTIDSGYRGEVSVLMINNSGEAVSVMSGDKVAQIVLMPVQQAVFVGADELDETERGEGGFGSTGVRDD